MALVAIIDHKICYKSYSHSLFSFITSPRSGQHSALLLWTPRVGDVEILV